MGVLVASFFFTTTVLVPESSLVTVPWTALTTSSSARSGRISRLERIRNRSTRLGMGFSSRAFEITENKHEDYRRGVRKYRGKSTRKEHHETVKPDTSRE